MILGQEMFPKPDFDKTEEMDRAIDAYREFEKQMATALMYWGVHSPFNENFVRLEAKDGSELGIMTLLRHKVESEIDNTGFKE
jgi:hypothetical protein